MNPIKRHISNEILEMAKSYPIVTLTGPRQSGKTTLAKALFPQKIYVSLEDPDERAFAESDPRGFLARFADEAIIDEVQRFPPLLSYLQGIVDECSEKGLFILTGSHQWALHEAISQSLAGRSAILKLLPCSLGELFPAQKDFTVYEYLFHGMYPRIYADQINSTKFYRDYVATYVERDVRQMINIKDLNLFQNFLKLCAGRIGQLLNTKSLANDLGISHSTVMNWLSVLEASFVIYRLTPYFENFGKRLIKSPKLYFSDTGLARYLLDILDIRQLPRDPLRGHLFENFVVNECIKQRLNVGIMPNFYFYRDSNQNEVDLLYREGSKLVAIEIKSGQTFQSAFIKSLKGFQKITGERFSRGFLVYSGHQEQKIEDYQLLNFKHVERIFIP